MHAELHDFSLKRTSANRLQSLKNRSRNDAFEMSSAISMHNTGQRSNPPAIKFMLISRAWGFPSDALEARVGEP